MDKRALRNDFIEIVANGLDSWEAQRRDPVAAVYEKRHPMERYIGKEYPPPYVEFNHFKPMVDLLVAQLFFAIERREG